MGGIAQLPLTQVSVTASETRKSRFLAYRTDKENRAVCAASRKWCLEFALEYAVSERDLWLLLGRPRWRTYRTWRKNHDAILPRRDLKQVGRLLGILCALDELTGHPWVAKLHFIQNIDEEYFGGLSIREYVISNPRNGLEKANRHLWSLVGPENE